MKEDEKVPHEGRGFLQAGQLSASNNPANRYCFISLAIVRTKVDHPMVEVAMKLNAVSDNHMATLMI